MNRRFWGSYPIITLVTLVSQLGRPRAALRHLGRHRPVGDAGGGSVGAMSPEDRPGADIEVVDELRFLAESLRRVDAATATAHFDDEEAMACVVAEAHAELTLARDAVEDILAAGASAAWRARAADHAWAVTRSWDSPPTKTAGQARADAVVAIALARAAVAEAVLEVARTRDVDVGDVDSTPARRTAVLRVAPMSGVGRRVAEEVRHVIVDRPRAILIRLLATLGI